MRKLLLFSAMVVAAGLAPAATAAASVQAGPTAQQLLAKTTSCKQVSNGKYKTDEETGRTIAVCDAGSAVFWKADMDVDCDGQPTARCNKNTDPWFQDGTAYPRSDGKALVADETPYIVVPSISSTWNFEKAGLKGAGSCAVIYNDKVLYTVIGDTGPKNIIGEASYATAKALGINPDPKNGGVDSGVTYICFKNSKVSPIENHGKATSVGEGLAAKWVG
ncbi:glycoside hydrolase family 75 protein [Amycolatopsis keratiniphila]|uniref:glycoside hydrolase family 75 protein n=1 Tax=Amycolatopsis japonica group TaxID=2893673 RepID=UPI003321D976